MNIYDKRLILVAGKGGVGRSTVAASIAAAAARRGRRTLLYEYNANDRFGDFFGTAPLGPEITCLRENLYAVNTTPAAALEEYGLMVLRFKRVYRMVFENRLTRHFLRAIPGLEDYAILGKVWHHVTHRSQDWDTVVFDMAASGHSLSMLKIPWIVLKTVPEGPLTRDARSIRRLLLDRSQTSLILVTLAEEMPANEAEELAADLQKELGLEVARLVINQVYPDRFPAASPQHEVAIRAAASADPDLLALGAHARVTTTRRTLNERHIERLRAGISAPLTRIPRLFCSPLGQAEIEYLSQLVEHELGPKP